MAVFSFDADELEGIAPFQAQEQYLKKFGFVPPPLPEGYSHSVPAQKQPANRITPPPSPSRSATAQARAHDHTGFEGAQTAMPANRGGGGGGERINTLVAKRNNKKRIQPSFVGSLAGNVPSAAIAPPSSSSGAVAQATSSTSMVNASSSTMNGSARLLPISSSNNSRSLASMSFTDEGFGSVQDQDSKDFVMGDDMDTDVQIIAFNAGAGASNGGAGRGGKRKALDGVDDRLPSKPRTLGGDRPRDPAPAVAREIAFSGEVAPGGWGVGLASGSGLGLEGRLDMPRLLTYLKVNVEGSEDVFEGRNAEDGGEFSFCMCA